MNKHRLTLLGGTHGELRVPADVLLETIGALLEGARRATRFFVEGESTRKGPRPAWLDAACRVDVTALAAGSAVLELEAPTLEDADPSRFGEDGQGALFEERDPTIATRTSVELFGSVLAAVVEGDAEGVMADRALLDTCVRFARASGDRFAGVQLDGLRGRDKSLAIRPEHLPRFELLRDETPMPQAVRVAGVLDTISVSRSDVILKLPDGTKVPARLEDHDSVLLQQLFGKQVVVSGMAHYRPSGQLLLVDVEALVAASERDRLFSTLSVARARRPVAVDVAQDEMSGVSAFYGTWPGDESEDELLDALEAIG